MGLSEAVRDSGSGEATRVDRRDQQRCIAPTGCASSASGLPAVIRPAQISNHEQPEQCYDGFLECGETEEVVEKQAMNFTITADEATLMPNDTPNAESQLTEAYNVETISVDGIRTGAGGRARLMGEVD